MLIAIQNCPENGQIIEDRQTKLNIENERKALKKT